MATTTKQAQLERRIGDIDELVQRLETSADPALRATARELVQAVMDLHGSALERIMDVLARGGAPGEAFTGQLARDDLVKSVLLLHGLHPVDLETRVLDALERTRPYLKSHGGNVELVGIDEDDVVRLQMQGSCHGCPSSAITLKLAIEQAIHDAAPEVTSIIVVDASSAPSRAAPQALVGLELARRRDDVEETDVAWEVLHGIDGMSTAEARIVPIGGRDILLCRAGESLYAYGDRCPACEQAFANARIDGSTLTCGACGETYDVIKAGRGIGQPAHHLEPYPLLVEDGLARVALPLVRA